MSNSIKGVILAQPKSASTSLMKTVGEISGESCGQQFYFSPPDPKQKTIDRFVRRMLKLLGYGPVDRIDLNERLRDTFPAVEYSAMSMAHSDVVDLGIDPEAAKELTLEYAVHKQHFPPTRGNWEYLSGIPKVLLTRSTADTIDSYKRVPHETRFSSYLENPRFVAKLEAEIVSWKKGWQEFAKDSDEVISVDFKDLVHDTKEVVIKVLQHFGLESPECDAEIALSKERYYRT